jgi:hypothetical protein
METLKRLVSTPQGEQLIDLTAEEVAQRKIEEQQAEADRAVKLEKIAQEKARKESAIAKLNALGLTQEEILSILK